MKGEQQAKIMACGGGTEQMEDELPDAPQVAAENAEAAKPKPILMKI
jgi:hypothetical protein